MHQVPQPDAAGSLQRAHAPGRSTNICFDQDACAPVGLYAGLPQTISMPLIMKNSSAAMSADAGTVMTHAAAILSTCERFTSS